MKSCLGEDETGTYSSVLAEFPGFGPCGLPESMIMFSVMVVKYFQRNIKFL